MWFGNGYLSSLYACPRRRRVILMYDVMLDFPIVSPTETTMEGLMVNKGISYFQQGEYISLRNEQNGFTFVIMNHITEPKPNDPLYDEANTYIDLRKEWEDVGKSMLEKRYIPIDKKEVRNLNSWTKLPNGSLFKQMQKEESLLWNKKVWRNLGNGRFKHIGVSLDDGVALMAAYEHYSNRIMSIPLIKRFKDKDLKSMNIYVGETVADLLSNFTLDIPREQFVFPYPHGVSFVRKDFTTYLYQENEKIKWSYFGKDGKVRVNVIDLEDITNNGRISEKSISKFFKSEKKELETNVSEFMNDYFERQFGLHTEKIDSEVLSVGLIKALTNSSWGIASEYCKVDGIATVNIDYPHKEMLPGIWHCWNMMTEDLLKIICLNDRDFANEKLKKNSKGKAIISNTNPKRVGRRYFKWGEDDIQYVYPKGGKSGVKVRRHMRRGHTKRQPIKYPENYDGKAFQMGGSWYVSKTIAPYWAGGSLSIPENQISPFCFGAIKMKYAGGSRIASQWIRGIEKDLGRKLVHKENGGKEYRVPYNDSKWFFLDAWDEETNTAYEFHGDYYHGNPNIFNAEDINKTTKKTFGEMYNATMQKKEILEELGYNYVCIWESEFM
jgi:hypothetical protein